MWWQCTELTCTSCLVNQVRDLFGRQGLMPAMSKYVILRSTPTCHTCQSFIHAQDYIELLHMEALQGNLPGSADQCSSGIWQWNCCSCRKYVQSAMGGQVGQSVKEIQKHNCAYCLHDRPSIISRQLSYCTHPPRRGNASSPAVAL